jgi:hypothetical protein
MLPRDHFVSGILYLYHFLAQGRISDINIGPVLRQAIVLLNMAGAFL